jgi:Glycosyltransferases involved in cell wall biogenesis
MNSVAGARVCVVIPTYNRSDMLGQAIASALLQDYPGLEVLIADNASTDATASLMARYAEDKRVRYIRNQENIGMVNNWRQAIAKHTTADWFMLLSDDDWLLDSTYVSRAMALVKEHPAIRLVYAAGYILNESSGTCRKMPVSYRGVMSGTQVFSNWGATKTQEFMLCNVLFHRDTALSLNPFTNADNLSCDSELLLKMTLCGDVGVIDDPVAVYRVHGANLIGRVVKDVTFLLGNLDFVIEPYLMAAAKLGADSPVVRDYVRNIGLIDYLGMTLLLCLRHFPAYEQVCREMIWQRVPELAGEVERRKKYMFKRLLIAYAPLAYDAVLYARNRLVSIVGCVRGC